jgi:hypothetical protein
MSHFRPSLAGGSSSRDEGAASPVLPQSAAVAEGASAWSPHHNIRMRRATEPEEDEGNIGSIAAILANSVCGSMRKVMFPASSSPNRVLRDRPRPPPAGHFSLNPSVKLHRERAPVRRVCRQCLQTFSTAPPDSTQSLKPPRFRTSLYPRSCNVLPASADRPPEAQ